MLTILEGPDGGGKTTFARGFTGPVFDHGPYPNDTTETLARRYVPMINAGLQEEQVVLGDRSWLAEPVYGRAFRGGMNRIPVAYRRMLERAALNARAVVVLFLPGVERCCEVFRGRYGEEYLTTTNQLREVYEGYLGYLRGADFLATPPGFDTDLPIVVADYRTMKPGQIAAAIEAVRPRWSCVGGGGLLDHESVLIVGDRPASPYVDGSLDGVPFAPLDRRGSSSWLTEQLEEAGIRERDLYWVNAYHHDGSRDVTVEKVLDGFGFREVIALGENARKRLQEIGLSSYLTVDHPQYWKRFKYGVPYPLIQLIKEIDE